MSDPDHASSVPHATDAVASRDEAIDGDIYNPRLLVGPQRILLPENTPKYTAVSVLQQRIKTNEFGFPTHFIRSDRLPFDLGALTEDDLDNACEGLFYYDGYPQMENGVSFWHQLPHEGYENYLLFTRYIEQAEEVGIRQLDLLSVSLGIELQKLQTLYHEFLWALRARAHDVFIVAADQKRRFLKTRKTEDRHFNMAQGLLDRLMQKFADPEWIEELNAKEALEALDTLAKLQRLSLGLTGQHASSTPKDRLPDGASPEAIIRNITRNAGLGNQAQDTFQGKLKALLDNPEEGMVLQAAILTLGRQDSYEASNVMGE